MVLKAIYDKKDDIPEQFQELYSERNGKWELTGIEGVKTVADVERVQIALSKEKENHKETKEKLKGLDKFEKFEDMDPEQLAKDLEELEELRAKIEAGLGDKFDQEKFDAAVEKIANARVKTATAPLERELGKAKEQLETVLGENKEFKTKELNRTISDAVRKAASTSKVIDTALDDVLMLGERVFELAEDGAVVTRDGVGVTPGIAPDIWLSEMQEKRPHWWPASQGGGANGGTGSGSFANNPFSSESWNMTAQGKLVLEDRSKAERMAKAAGTSIGGPRPTPKKA